MQNWPVNLTDPELFGNETAEDEDEKLFESYAYIRPEFETFLDQSKKVQVVRAYKGEGKSALLRWTALQLRDKQDTACHRAFANSIVPPSDSFSGDGVRLWKESFIRIGCAALGASLRFEFNDDVVSLREQAELGGFSSRSFVGSILARVKSIAGSLAQAGAANAEQSLKRILDGKEFQIWLLIDDLDENFRNTEADCVRVSSSLVAMRQIASEIPEFRFRTSIRPSTWAIIKPKFEALSKVEPYVMDLQWGREQLEDLLANRVKSYLTRNVGAALASGKLKTMSSRELVAVVFGDPMPWGKKGSEMGLGAHHEMEDKFRSPVVVVSTLSRFRPRWMVEICKLAATRAKRRGNAKIGLDDLTDNLAAFGAKRIEDLSAEFHAQCEKIELLIQSFKGKPEHYKTDELFKHLRQNASGRDIRIAGISGRATEAELARFLFQIGFLTARRDFPDGRYMHYSFYDEPTLLSAGANDVGASWEVPSCFRQALDLSNARRMPR